MSHYTECDFPGCNRREPHHYTSDGPRCRTLTLLDGVALVIRYDLCSEHFDAACNAARDAIANLVNP